MTPRWSPRPLSLKVSVELRDLRDQYAEMSRPPVAVALKVGLRL
jgi:hypothetical protein